MPARVRTTSRSTSSLRSRSGSAGAARSAGERSMGWREPITPAASRTGSRRGAGDDWGCERTEGMMATTTDAILVYGFEVEEDSEDYERLSEITDGDVEAVDLVEVETKTGVDLVFHGSDPAPLYILGVRPLLHR